MGYASIIQVKDYLGIAATSVDDNLLEDLISRAEGMIDAYTGRNFEAVTATKYFGSEVVSGQDLTLYGNDLLTVTTLTNGDAVVIAGTDYRLFPRNDSPKWLIKLDSGKSWEFSTDDSEISIAGTWGYSATAPADIEHACVRLTAFLYRQKDTSADIDRPIITGDGVTIMPSGLPSDVTKMLDRYKRRIA